MRYGSIRTAIATLVVFGARDAIAADAFEAPPGFEVTLFAPDELAHDIYSMTTNAIGEIVVSGRGYIKTLHDRDDDGRADDVTLYSDWPPGGVHGMYFDGDDAIVSAGDGLYRLSDDDRDGKADRRERWLPSRGAGEHAANGVVKGPDGWYYWICGNDAGIGREHAQLPGSPVKDTNCGAVVRVAPDGSTSDVYAHGFRNPYDLDFHAHGEILTYDADGERVQHLPWYTPTRIFDVAPGMHHGWRLRGWQHAWSRPASNLDSVERLWEVGRGSPTGVLVYRHDSFPAHYRGGLFAVCWSLGNLYFFPLARRGSTYATSIEVFLRPRGDTGFAPVDIAVAPRGDIYLAIGGRGTRGSVFRIRWTGADRPRQGGAGLAAILDAPQPLASWSRARWVPAAGELGRDPFLRALAGEEASLTRRIRALEILVELFGGVTAEEAGGLVEDDPELVARLAWALARGTRAKESEESEESASLLAALTRRDDPRIARAAWEAIAALPSLTDDVPSPDWLRGFAHSDRRVRAASTLAARGAGAERFRRDLPDVDTLREPRHVLGWLHARGLDAAPGESRRRLAIEKCLDAFDASADAEVRLDAVRLIQLALGDVALVQDQPEVTDGYRAAALDAVPAELREAAATRLATSYPHGDSGIARELDRELERLFAMLEVASPDFLAKVAARWSESSLLEDDVHAILATARVPGERAADFRARLAAAFARLQHKMRAEHRDPSRFWPHKMSRALRAHIERDALLAPALVDEGPFGLPEHAIFAAVLPDDAKHAAARKLIARARLDGVWSAELVRLTDELPRDECLVALRKAFEHEELRDVAAPLLAQRAEPSDRRRLVAALATRRGDVARAVARALASFPARNDPGELIAILETLRRFCSLRDEEKTRAALHVLLSSWTNRTVAVRESGDPHRDYAFWFEWFAGAYPEAAKELAAPAVAAEPLAERLARVDWSTGDARRGEGVFAARGCKSCHVGGQRLGPDLAGVATRFAREDLFRAIAEPSRDVSPAYAATEVVTTAGETHRGLMIYQSPATTLLQVSLDRTVRFTDADVVALRPSTVSFMPEGLLDDLDEQGLADLDTYLRTLRAR